MITRKFYKENLFWILLAVTCFAAISRILSCFWGAPLQIHPDEPTIVNNSINMIYRHSWEAFVYNRPDQFEIKCNAILFTIVSWIKYQMPAYEAIREHKMTFFLVARFYTAAFGIALIPLASLFVGRLLRESKIKKIVQVSVACIVAFSPTFIQQSAYATPDIPLTFFVLLFAYCFMQYLETPNTRNFLVCSVIVGISISIKYPAAIMCLPLAFMVIYRALAVDKNYKIIFKRALIGVAAICATVFVIAPNLFTDIGSVYKTLLFETRTSHLGADGFGFFGNLIYYIKVAMSDLGYESFLFFVAGIAYVITHKSIRFWSLTMGALYWICLSTLSLHWPRWGVPMFLFYNIVVAIGVGASVQWISAISNRKRSLRLGLQIATYCVTGIVGLNLLLSALAITKFSTTVDARSPALQYCSEVGITLENSIAEGYTPLIPAFAGPKHNAFILTGNSVALIPEEAHKKYFVFSNSYRGRYLAQPNAFSNELAVYNAVEQQYKLLYKIEGSAFELDPFAVQNVFKQARYLAQAISATGDSIYIYDLSTN